MFKSILPSKQMYSMMHNSNKYHHTLHLINFLSRLQNKIPYIKDVNVFVGRNSQNKNVIQYLEVDNQKFDHSFLLKYFSDYNSQYIQLHEMKEYIKIIKLRIWLVVFTIILKRNTFIYIITNRIILYIVLPRAIQMNILQTIPLCECM